MITVRKNSKALLPVFRTWSAFLDERKANSFEEGDVTSIWIISLILGFSVTDARFTAVKQVVQQPKPVFTVVVRNLIDADLAIRNIAKAEAIRILDKAGVELQWIDANGSEDPDLPSETTRYATVVIAAQRPRGWTKPDAMGFAPARTGPHPRAYVFSALISTFLGRYTIEDKSAFGIILGHAIVHELGHLMIPGDAHGKGIMQPDWGYREWREAMEGSLLFTPNNAQAIRRALSTR
jgi:hypothetical protein